MWRRMTEGSGGGSSSAFHLEGQAKIDKVHIEGSVAGRDVVITASDVDNIKTRQELLEMLAQLQAQVAALEGAPGGLRQDAGDELKKAQEAGEEGDNNRLVEKLETAQGYIERIATTLPAALSVAQAVAALAQRATGLG
jgi:hypothetical protein